MAEILPSLLRASALCGVWLLLFLAALALYMLSPRARLAAAKRQRARVSLLAAAFWLIGCGLASWLYGFASGVIVGLAGGMVFLTLAPVLAVSFRGRSAAGHAARGSGKERG